MRVDERIKGIRNSDLRVGVTRKTILLQIAELRGDACKFIYLPRRRAIVIEQPEECLLLPTEMAVKRPCKRPLRTYHQSQIGVHPAHARRPVETAATCRELVEPDWRI